MILFFYVHKLFIVFFSFILAFGAIIQSFQGEWQHFPDNNKHRLRKDEHKKRS